VNAEQFLRPTNGARRYVQAPVTQLRHSLRFYKLFLCLPQGLFRLLMFGDVLQNTSYSIDPGGTFDGKVRYE
jgi:hypothetical protein